jgi:hypothetical protein
MTPRYDNGSPVPDSTVVIHVYEHRGRSEHFAFADSAESCACGVMRLLVPLRLRISTQPFLDMGRSLLAAAVPSIAEIIMARNERITLRSTVGAAAKLCVTTSRSGTPVFRKHREKRQSQPRTREERQTAINVGGRPLDEPAGPAPALVSRLTEDFALCPALTCESKG